MPGKTEGTISKGLNMRGQLAYVGHKVWVGNYDTCNQTGFQNVIHVWHEDQPGLCDQVVKKRVKGLAVKYKEATDLEDNILDAVYNYAKTPGELFIHCAAGLSRSPTLAIVCKVARGCDPYQAMADITKGLREQYLHKHAPFFHGKPLNNVLNFLEKKNES